MEWKVSYFICEPTILHGKVPHFFYSVETEEIENGVQFDPDSPIFHASAENVTIVSSSGQEYGMAVSSVSTDDDDDETEVVPNFFAQPCVTAMPPSGVFGTGAPATPRLDSVIVIIRHGKTQHNKLGVSSSFSRL